MKLLLSLCLTCLLLHIVASLFCHVCDDDNCSNKTSVKCPVFSVCRTMTSLSVSNSFSTLTVNKNCSSLLDCFPPFTLGQEVEWSINYGFAKQARVQLCCSTDNCNSQTLAVPSRLSNGNQCPACASLAEAQSGSCNSTQSCEGVENTCFGINSGTSNSTQFQSFGCISRNLCSILFAIPGPLGENVRLTCGAPGSTMMSAVCLIFAAAAFIVLL